MKIGSAHLTYCMNVHPGESLGEILAALDTYARPIAQRVAQDAPFGIGLRVANHASQQLQDPAALEQLRTRLQAHRMYAFTINGFPYGIFHGRPVKSDVYLPDWSSPERVSYTERLANVLAALLPEDVDGSISTVPLGYRASDGSYPALSDVVANVMRSVAGLWQLEQNTGKHVSLALEPEPDCVLQLTREVCETFERHFFAGPALVWLAHTCGVGRERAREICAAHLGVCVDTCHAAVEFESAPDVFSQLRAHGITVAKIQLSSGLKVVSADHVTKSALRAFDEPVYLHQVVVRRPDATLVRYPDLTRALDEETAPGAEWRVHFHVPLHVANYGRLDSTQDFVREVLSMHGREALSTHLEVETYTWDVLPERTKDLVESIAREVGWVKRQLGNGTGHG